MRIEIYGMYCRDYDMTFIVESKYNGDEIISTEVKGLYHGEPNDEANKRFYNKTFIDYTE